MLTLKPDIAKQVFLTWLEEDYRNLQLYCDVYNSLPNKVQFHTKEKPDTIYTISSLERYRLSLNNNFMDRESTQRYIKMGWWIITT
jgi:hypothetical protein